MSILSWGLDFDLAFGTRAPFGRVAKANYTIETDQGNSIEDLQTITKDSRYPARMSPLAEDPTMLCVNTELKQDKYVPNHWSLYVEWDNVTPQPFPTFFDNPLKREAQIQAGTYETVFRLETDQDGKIVATTAGEMIFLEIPVRYRQFTITKNVSAIPEAFAEQADFTNLDTVTIMGHPFKTGRLLLKDVTMDGPHYENGTKFWIAIFTILSRPDGWLFKRRNVGFQEKGPLGAIKLADGTLVLGNPLQSIQIGPPGNRSYPSSPVLLDPQGRAYRGTDLNTGQEVVLTPETNSTGGITAQQWKDSLLSFRGYRTIAFTGNVPLT